MKRERRHRVVTGWLTGVLAGLGWLLGLASGSACADTTWVSGQVAGEWTREGSPYIITDSTWVAEGDTLILTGGSTVFFMERQGLHVRGYLNVVGAEGDSVSITAWNGVQRWSGIRFAFPRPINLSYASIIALDSFLVIQAGSIVSISHCRISAVRPIAGDGPRGIRNCNIAIYESSVYSSAHYISTGGQLMADRSIVDFSNDLHSREPGFWSDGTIYRFSNCIIVGHLYDSTGGSLYADSSQFIAYDGWRNYGIGTNIARMTYCSIDGSVGGVTGQFYHNQVADNLAMTDNASVRQCVIGNGFQVSGGASISNCTVQNGWVIIRPLESERPITIDSSYFSSYEDGSFRLLIIGAPNVSISRSIFSKSGYFSFRQSHVVLTNNTILFSDSSGGGITASNYDNYLKLTNNILIGSEYVEYELFAGYVPPDSNLIRYNCIWLFGRIANSHPSNLFINPEINWRGNLPQLSEQSPCIDAGDPESQRDPDGTRADIGASYYDQRPERAPSLESSLVVNSDMMVVYPNPFNSHAAVNISIPPMNWGVSGRLVLIDPLGRVVRDLTSKGRMEAGRQTLTLDGSSLPSGFYLLRLDAAGQTLSRKVQLVK
ncbi:MAG: T9SS type A sorting domain-containing protein [Calditrichaeota bacterium]|nr:T9SS type A sorting domain-containing protein [Calditrichota bacterium]